MKLKFRILLYLIEILHQTTTKEGNGIKVSLLYLIEILHQTTTAPSTSFLVVQLYLIEILHQTTTSEDSPLFCYTLYLIEILHQTTTLAYVFYTVSRCILSKFYIKPQLEIVHRFQFVVVSYRNSTSNHNNTIYQTTGAGLYLIEILHQTTTSSARTARLNGCILSKFYIKPQRRDLQGVVSNVVSYRNSTSNHNPHLYAYWVQQLYLIEILHQTTTRLTT